jgi:hypothetical protein
MVKRKGKKEKLKEGLLLLWKMYLMYNMKD